MAPSEVDALVLDHTFVCRESDSDQLRMDVRALRDYAGLCPVCGEQPAYNEAIYCGAACAALDGA